LSDIQPTTRKRAVEWLLVGILVAAIGAGAVFFDRWSSQRYAEKNEDLARKTRRYLQPLAEDVAGHACGMLVWIDHVQLKPSDPWPTTRDYGQGSSMPWEPVSDFTAQIASLEMSVNDARTMSVLEAQEQVWSVRNANSYLQDSASDLLTAMLAAQSGLDGTAKQKFAAARKHADQALGEIRKGLGDETARCSDQ
jgi:hypothetical protein